MIVTAAQELQKLQKEKAADREAEESEMRDGPMEDEIEASKREETAHAGSASDPVPSTEKQIGYNLSNADCKPVDDRQLVPLRQSSTKVQVAKKELDTAAKQVMPAASMQVEKYHQQWFDSD
jgi:hypothetical protein